MQQSIRPLPRPHRVRRLLASESFFAVLLIVPMLVVLLAFGVFPILYSLVVSLLEWKLNIPRPAEFVGLANYARLFTDPVFTSSLLKTLYYTVFSVSGTVLLGLAIALLLDRDDVKAKGLILALLIIPWAVPRVVGGLLWKWIFDGNYGILNAALLGMGAIDRYHWWFGESPLLALTLVGITQVWRDTPFSAMLFLAGLQSVPVHLHRAAMMDGATGVQRFRFVTLPSIRYVLLAVAVLQTTWALKTFDLVYVLTGGGPANKTMLTYLYVYRVAFSYLDVGYGSAMAYFVTMLVFVVAFFYYRLAGRTGQP
jgi:ABC-type sugar transport system permease subunit